MMLTHH